MDKNKTDIRVNRTKDALKKAFIDLIKVVSIEKLTINQICTSANVNRITFYNHYHDKYDLFNNIMFEENVAIRKIIAEESKNYDVKTNPYIYVTMYIKHYVDLCFEKKDFFLAIFAFQENSILRYMLKSSLEESIRNLIIQCHLEHQLGVPIDLYIPFIVGGIYEFVNYCISSNTSFSKEELVKCIMTLLSNTISKNRII